MGGCSGKAPGLHRPERMCAQCFWSRILLPGCSVSRRSSRLSADGAASGPSTVSAVRVSLVLLLLLSLETHTTRPNAARGVSQIPKTTVTGRCGCMVEPPDWCAPLDPSWRAGLNICVLRQTTQARLVLSSRRTVGCFNGRCICPITLQLMEDPVTTSDGHCYERRSIEDWLRCPWPSSWPCLPALGTLVARAAGRTTRARRQTRSWPTRISYPCEPG